MTLCYLIGFLCGLLAYVIYGLTVDLCPSDYQSYPYSAVNAQGVREPLQREDVYVFGQLYKFNVMQEFFDTQHMNLTKDFQGMEIGPLFNGDTNNDCAAYASVSNCTLTSPSGKQKQARFFSMINYIRYYTFCINMYSSGHSTQV